MMFSLILPKDGTNRPMTARTNQKAPTLPPDYLGHRARLRERFLNDGGKSMADYEIIELMLTYAIPRRDVKPIAKEIIRKFGSLAGAAKASVAKLLEVRGISENSAVLFKLTAEAARRFSWAELSASDTPVISNWDAMIDYCRSEMAHLDIEEFRIIFLDIKCRVIGEEIMQKGTINQVAIHPREVLKLTMEKKASALILVHNHPSGDVKPSRADIEITKQIKQALESINVSLLDHVIIGKYDYASLKSMQVI